jgi:flagellar hook-basal body complex protein FliE
MDLSLSAVRSYGAARPLTAPDPAAVPRGNFAAELGRAAESFAHTLARAEATAGQAMTGQGDPHALVTALAEAQLAVETVVAVRDRVVEAYMEILRMPV